MVPSAYADAEGEHVEPVGPGPQRVRLLVREMDEAVAFADLVGAGSSSPRQRRGPEPPSTKKISSSAPSRWSGVDHLPGSTWIRCTPT